MQQRKKNEGLGDILTEFGARVVGCITSISNSFTSGYKHEGMHKHKSKKGTTFISRSCLLYEGERERKKEERV